MPKLSYIIVLIGVFAAFPAGADSLDDGDFSASLSLGVSNLDVPRNQFILDREDGAPFRTFGSVKTDLGGGFAPHLNGEVAYRITEGGKGMPAFGVAARGDFQHLTMTQQRSFDDTGPTVSFGWTSFNGFGLRTIDGFELIVSSDRDFKYAIGEVLVTATTPLGEDLSVSLFAGPSTRLLQ